MFVGLMLYSIKVIWGYLMVRFLMLRHETDFGAETPPAHSRLTHTYRRVYLAKMCFTLSASYYIAGDHGSEST